MGPASWVGNRMCDIYQRKLGVVEVRASRWAAMSRREGGLEHKVAAPSLNLSAVDLGARAHEPLIVDAAGVRLCRRQGKSRYEDNARIAPSSYRTLHVDGVGCHRSKREV